MNGRKRNRRDKDRIKWDRKRIVQNRIEELFYWDFLIALDLAYNGAPTSLNSNYKTHSLAWPLYWIVRVLLVHLGPWNKAHPAARCNEECVRGTLHLPTNSSSDSISQFVPVILVLVVKLCQVFVPDLHFLSLVPVTIVLEKKNQSSRTIQFLQLEYIVDTLIHCFFANHIVLVNLCYSLCVTNLVILCYSSFYYSKYTSHFVLVNLSQFFCAVHICARETLML